MRLTLVLTMVLGCGLAHAKAASIRSYFNHRVEASYVDSIHKVSRNGDDLEAVILAEIGKAKTSIFVAVQELRLPSIAKLLVAKARAGVDVRVVLEDSYNHNITARPNGGDGTEQDNPDAYDALRFRELVALTDVDGDGRVTIPEMAERDAVYILQQAKIPLHDDTIDGSQGSGLMHHKFVVIDGRTVIMSSANFTASCIHGDALNPTSRGNANAMMVADSAPLAALFTEEFAEMWAGRFGQRKRFRGARSVKIGTKQITVQFSPTSKLATWSQSTNGLIASHLAQAEKSIQSALFVFSEQQIANAMQQAHGQATVSVVVDPKFAFRPYSEVLDLLGLTLLDPQTCHTETGNAPWRQPADRVGVPTLARGDLLHHKFAVVDTKKVIFGSHNWSESANSTNDEFAVVLEDNTVATKFAHEFERIGARARWGAPSHLKYKAQSFGDACARR